MSSPKMVLSPPNTPGHQSKYAMESDPYDSPLELEEERANRVRETFPLLDRNGDRLLDADDLRSVMTMIRAPKSYFNRADDIIWEVNDNNKKNYLERKDVEGIVKRVMNDQQTGCKEPTRLVNIIDFVSKDTNLTGYINARQCIVLLHNRFGRTARKVDLRVSHTNGNTLTQSKVSFKEFLSQVEIRQNIINS